MGRLHSKLIDCCCYHSPYDPHSDTSTQDSINDTFELPRRMPRHETPNARPATVEPNIHRLRQHHDTATAAAAIGTRDPPDESALIIEPGVMYDDPLVASTPERNQSRDRRNAQRQRFHGHGTVATRGTSELGEGGGSAGAQQIAAIVQNTGATHVLTGRSSRVPKNYRRTLRRRSRLNVGPYIHGGVYSENELGLPAGEYMYSTHMF
ncbi:hypothetical protein Dda_4277 [Drechslerella dactyloides]|uniref:Uncharacterized protein n=1 Tax=Drechslerella dactyloides TaxID=74499 RepID=A0AAD6NKL1_DREDA|nr:hypothetical protein Dda_4277 [Drechslerella dactyloides]